MFLNCEDQACQKQIPTLYMCNRFGDVKWNCYGSIVLVFQYNDEIMAKQEYPDGVDTGRNINNSLGASQDPSVASIAGATGLENT